MTMGVIRRIGAVCACAVFIAVAAAVDLRGEDGQRAQSATATAGEALFAPIASVLMHPRCVNCHPVTDYPRQSSDRHRHQFLVARGADDRGAPGARCAQCHQSQNQNESGVPGAADWRLAPLAMAWESEPGVVMTASALCRRVLDKSRNGGRDLHALEEHMENDHFIKWAWNPGTDSRQQQRETPPLSHEVFMQAVRRWTAAGAPCPD
jgi:hypothetical protein